MLMKQNHNSINAKYEEKINDAYTIGCYTLQFFLCLCTPGEIAESCFQVAILSVGHLDLGLALRGLNLFTVQSQKEIFLLRFVSGGCDSLVKIWREGEDGR